MRGYFGNLNVKQRAKKGEKTKGIKRKRKRGEWRY